MEMELRMLGACAEALRWVQQFEDPVEAWQACNRAYWMAWILETLGYDELMPLGMRGSDCGKLCCALEGLNPNEIRKLIPVPL